MRLKVSDFSESGLDRHGFNSKLVRLKVEYLAETAAPTSRFQFQTGAIKRFSSTRCPPVRAGFNSKLVRLKAAGFEANEIVGIGVSIPNWCD